MRTGSFVYFVLCWSKFTTLYTLKMSNLGGRIGQMFKATNLQQVVNKSQSSPSVVNIDKF